MLVVDSSKRLVDQTRGNLEAARDSYDRAASRLIESQSQLSKTIAEMTSLSLTNAGLQAMLPILKQAVGAFTSAVPSLLRICSGLFTMLHYSPASTVFTTFAVLH